MQTRVRAASVVLCLALAPLGACRRTASGVQTTDEHIALRRAQADGRRLSPQQAEQLERALEQSPGDVASRLRLVFYYYPLALRSPEARASHARNVLWIVENEPHGEMAGLLQMGIFPEVDADGYARVKAAWLKQVERFPSDANVVGNAALFLYNCRDRLAADPLFQRARELAPRDARWPRKLGEIRANRARWGGGRTKAASELACEALAYLREADQKEQPRGGDGRLLSDIAESALACGDLREATLQAQRALERDPKDGSTQHEARQTLGRVALRQGDAATAVKYLIESTRVPASPVMRSFGPQFELAQELLAQGQRDAVLEYLRLCRSFWYKTALIDRWEAEIRAGRVPRLAS